MVLDSTVDRDLERAAHRAFVRNITAKLVDMARAGHDATEFYDVASFSTAGVMHRVRLDFTADGIDAACDCMAGQNGRICQHIACALDASQSIPTEEPEPVAPVLGLAWLNARLRGE